MCTVLTSKVNQCRRRGLKTEELRHSAKLVQGRSMTQELSYLVEHALQFIHSHSVLLFTLSIVSPVLILALSEKEPQLYSYFITPVQSIVLSEDAVKVGV